MGLFGIDPHIQDNKAWYNPTRYDLGVSELAAKLLGEKLTNQGGSDLSRSYANQVYTPPTQTPPANNPPAPAPTDRKILTNPIPNNSINNVPSQPQPQSSTPNYDEEINAIYNPAMDSLNNTQALLGQQKGNLEAGALSTKDRITNLLNQQLVEGNQNFDTQQQTVFNANRSAAAEALKSYNAMQQNLLSRYGTGSGVYGTTSEILAQSKLQGDYSLQEGFQNAVTQIVQSQIKLKRTVDDEILNTQKDYEAGIKEINLAFQQKVNDIESQRNLLKSQKAEARLQALKETTQRVQAIQDRKDEILWNIDLYQKTEGARIDNTAKSLTQQAIDSANANKGNIKSATTTPGLATYGGQTDEKSYLPEQKLLDPLLSENKDPATYWDVNQYFA